jgi:hypothetical protein
VVQNAPTAIFFSPNFKEFNSPKLFFLLTHPAIKLPFFSVWDYRRGGGSPRELFKISLLGVMLSRECWAPYPSSKFPSD